MSYISHIGYGADIVGKLEEVQAVAINDRLDSLCSGYLQIKFVKLINPNIFFKENNSTFKNFFKISATQYYLM